MYATVESKKQSGNFEFTPPVEKKLSATFEFTPSVEKKLSGNFEFTPSVATDGDSANKLASLNSDPCSVSLRLSIDIPSSDIASVFRSSAAAENRDP